MDNNRSVMNTGRYLPPRAREWLRAKRTEDAEVDSTLARLDRIATSRPPRVMRVMQPGSDTKPIPDFGPPDDRPLEATGMTAEFAELAPTIQAARAELNDVAVPAGYRPLRYGAVRDVVHDLARKRDFSEREAEPSIHYYRPNGVYMDSENYLTGNWDDVPKLEPDSYLKLILHSYGSPRHGKPDSLKYAQADAATLARWYVNDEDKCWEVGTPFPAEPERDDESKAVPLTPKVIRRIMRAVNDTAEHPVLSRSVDGMAYVATTGEALGPIVDEAKYPRDTLVVLSPQADPDDVEEYLHRLRVTPLGRVIEVDA